MDRLYSDEPSIKSESSDQPIGFIGRTIFGRNFFGRNFFGRTLHQVVIVRSANRIHRSEYFGRTIFGRTFFGRTFLSVRNPKIGPSHEWSQTARVTRSTSPLEYDKSSKETVGNGGRSRSTRKSRTFTCALSRYTRKSHTFTCAISRYTRKSCIFYAKSLTGA